METYRSGRNETDSKSVVLFGVPWVRIPPSLPKAPYKGVFFNTVDWHNFVVLGDYIATNPLLVADACHFE